MLDNMTSVSHVIVSTLQKRHPVTVRTYRNCDTESMNRSRSSAPRLLSRNGIWIASDQKPVKRMMTAVETYRT